MKHRIFIAINLPKNIKQKLKEALLGLEKNNRNLLIKWVKPEGIHITLHFLGYLTDEEIEKVDKMIREKIAETKYKISSYNLQIIGLGGFPNLRHPRVIFIDTQEINNKNIFDLQKRIGSGLEKLGIEIDKRPWHPHVTIGRAKRYLKNGINQKGIKILSSTFPVKSIEIMESKLSREGASYSVVRSYKL